MSKTPKNLIFDIESSPMLTWTYGLYNTNVIEVERQSHIMCFSYMWEGQSKKDIKCVSQLDFPARYKTNPYDDYDVVKALHSLFDEANIITAHNLNGFDKKVATGRFLVHNLLPPSPYKSIDTLTVARSKFKFSSNSLDKLGCQLNIGRKTKDSHGQLWHDCLNGDLRAWAKMIKYCNQDVWLLNQLYKRELPYITNHPNLAAIAQRPDACPNCLSYKIQSRGTQVTTTATYGRFQCQNCGHWFRERQQEKGAFEKPTYVNIS